MRVERLRGGDGLEKVLDEGLIYLSNAGVADSRPVLFHP